MYAKRNATCLVDFVKRNVNINVAMLYVQIIVAILVLNAIINANTDVSIQNAQNYAKKYAIRLCVMNHVINYCNVIILVLGYATKNVPKYVEYVNLIMRYLKFFSVMKKKKMLNFMNYNVVMFLKLPDLING